MREVCFQQFLDGLRRVLRFEVVIDLLPDIGVGTEPSAGEQMIAFDVVVILADGHFGAEKADIADVMLFAGMMTAAQKDIHRADEWHPSLSPVATEGSITLGLGHRNSRNSTDGAV